MNEDRPIRLAVDIGGTFVDAVAVDRRNGDVWFRKASTTPDRPWEGVLDALGRLGAPLNDAEMFIHGTTLGINAILERKGAVTGIITNEGFRDIFLIGRGNVPADHMYDFQYDRPAPLVPRRLTRGVPGRIDFRGDEVTPLDEGAVVVAAGELVEAGARSIAIAMLFSFRNPTHEQRAAELVRTAHPEVTVSVSSDITREHREYERTSTSVLEAYIRPTFEHYVSELEEGLRAVGFDGRFLIMRSGGGAMTSTSAGESPTHTILSGPAGGIVGAAHLARELGRRDLLSIDIGGTSLDAAVFEDGEAEVVHEAELEHHPLLIPVYDIRTIGAGGGSIAWIDDGLLQVGPQSAGAQPGPICYSRGGTEPTVTDAAVTLGYVDPATFLGGDMGLDVDGARTGIEARIGEPLGLAVEQAAAGIYSVLLARTVGAVRQITVERARDPRTFSMLAYGGAGPMIGPLLAREMGIPETIVPFAPSAFSAWGMLSADLIEDVARTDLRPLRSVSADDLGELLDELGGSATDALAAQGVAGGDIVLSRELELRYAGQAHALTVPVGSRLDVDELRNTFDEHHRRRYGHSMGNPVEILTVRVRGVGRLGRLELASVEAGDGNPSRAVTGERDAYCFAEGGMVPFAVYRRDRLLSGDVIAGPAIVDEDTSSTVVHSDQVIEVDCFGHLVVTTGEDRS